MEHLNLYTFKHSALPPLDNAMKGEIAEIDFNVSNLILKLQGHYRALSELHETLSNLLDSCDLNLECIRIVPDSDEDEAAPRASGLTDLPEDVQQSIAVQVELAQTAITFLSHITGVDEKMTTDSLFDFLRNKYKENPIPQEEVYQILAIFDKCQASDSTSQLPKV